MLSPTEKSSRFVPLAICAIFVLSSFAIVRPVVAATNQPNTPSLKQITLVDYGGSDASGVADLQANKIDAYDFSLTPSASSSLPASYKQYAAPQEIFGMYVNPQNTSAGTTGNFNPFYFQKVRFALNYIVDRNYFAQTLEGGRFVQCISAVCAEPDSAVVAAGVAPFSNVTYDMAYANTTIYNTLTANGVTYSNHQYSYKGKLVTVGLFDRTDDPIRHAFMEYLNTNLQTLGFQTNLIPGTLSVAYNVVFGTDPMNATYDIYPAANGQIWGYYDSNAVNFYSAYYADIPASDSYGPNWIGGWDNNTQEAASTALYNKADTYAIPILNSNFSSMAQRNDLLSNLTYYGVQQATYICIGTALAPLPTTGAVSGVTPNFLQDPFGNYQNFMTMTTSASDASGVANEMKMGVRHITNGAVNPVGGDNDAYSDVTQQAGALPLYGYGPSTGYIYSTAMKFKVNANTNLGNAPVPSSAIWFNGTTDQWQNVASGATAQDDVTVNVANYIDHTTWSDGQPVTLADMLYQYVEMQRVLAPGSPIYDNGPEHGLYTVESGQVVGFHVINATSVEVYTNGTYFPDATWAAYGAIGDVLSPLGYSGYTNGLGMTPWEVYYAMNQVVAGGQAAWSTSAAKANSVDWLNLLNPTDVGNVKAALSAAGSTIPPELTQLQSMTGQTWVTSGSATAGFAAAANFITNNGVAVISDGPYYISQYSASTSPPFMVMKPNPLFSAGSQADPNLFAPAVLLSPQATIPPVLTPGSSITVTTVESPVGSPNQTSPADNATVAYIFLSGGAIVYSSSATTGSNGQATLTVPSSMQAGSYLLNILASSQTSKLIQPLVTSLVVSAPSTTSSGSSASTSASSTTTGGGSNTTYYIAAGVVVVVVIALAAVFMRRRK